MTYSQTANSQTANPSGTPGKGHTRLLSMLSDTRGLLLSNNDALGGLLLRLFGPESVSDGPPVDPPIRAIGSIAELNEEILVISRLLKMQGELIKRVTDEI